MRRITTALSALALAGTAQAQTWIEGPALVSGSTDPEPRFGWSLAIAEDTLVVGTPGILNESGQAWVFLRSGGTWSLAQVLSPSDPGPSEDFAWSLATDGQTIVVGAAFEDSFGHDFGSVYIFERSGNTWTQTQKLGAPDASDTDRLGWDVGFDGQTIVASAYRDDHSSQTNAGSAYVFTHNGQAWIFRQKLIASDPSSGDEFGNAVDVEGDTIVVGAHRDDDGGGDRGSVYVFTRTGSVWNQTQEIQASDGANGDEFGESVDIDGGRFVVGSPNDNDAAVGAGSVYVFTRNQSGWNETAHIVPALSAGDMFGDSVALAGNTLVVGAPLTDGTDVDSGAVWAFWDDGGTWTPVIEIEPPTSVFDDQFGLEVAAAGVDVVLGSRWMETVFVDACVPEPVGYCTGKLNSCGAIPALSWSGLASATATSGFTVTGNALAGPKVGLWLFGTQGPAGIPFFGGTLCIAPPVRRGPIAATTGGTPGLCNWNLSIDTNALAQGLLGVGPHPELQAVGQTVYGQWWARDSGAFAVQLTDAVQYVVGP